MGGSTVALNTSLQGAHQIFNFDFNYETLKFKFSRHKKRTCHALYENDIRSCFLLFFCRNPGSPVQLVDTISDRSFLRF